MSDAADRPETQENSQVWRAFQVLLRPLVKAMIARGLDAPTAYRLMKKVYVEVAEEEFIAPGTRPTDSRISLLTGVHRKDVSALRDRDSRPSRPSSAPHVNTLTTVIGRWIATAGTADASEAQDSLPPSIPRLQQESSSLSFEQLVSDVSTDVRPRAVLDALLDRNLVEWDEDADMITLRSTAFIAEGESDEKLHFYAANGADHMAAATENLLQTKPPFFERAVFYNQIPKSALDRIEQCARDEAMKLLLDLNRESLDAQKSTTHEPDNSKERFRFGIYFYRTSDPREAPTDTGGSSDAEADDKKSTQHSNRENSE